MTPIQTNKPVFFDDEGNVLNGASIYIGQPGTDPRTNAKTVTFRDAGGAEFTAQQPLKTVNGRISYNGKPIVALVDGEHSMLVLDSAGKQTDYYRSINPDSGEADPVTFSDVSRVGLLLTDIKALDVAVGEVVENVGKTAVSDDLGAQWLAVSATGSSADDVDLIDFNNGLQGQRINNVAYNKDYIQSGTFILDSPASVVSTSDATSYRNTWTSVDCSSDVPNNSDAMLVRIYARASYGASGDSTIEISARVRKTGSGESPTNQNYVGRNREQGPTSVLLSAEFVSDVWIPKDYGSSADFDIYLIVNDPASGSNNTTPDLDISVIGYSVKPSSTVS